MTDQLGLQKAKDKIKMLEEQLKKTNNPGDRKGIKAKIARLHNLFTTEPL